MKFSVIVVCLNAGEKLRNTIDSVLCQTFDDYEIVVKDGGSIDGSLAFLSEDPYNGNLRIHIYRQKDSGIYDAMNQAAAHAAGDYLLFLNCGDLLFNENVLGNAAVFIQMEEVSKPEIFYGDTYNLKNEAIVSSPPEITGFTCYRHLPCHQSYIYAKELCLKKPYETKYKVRADYEHLLWCFYKEGVKMRYMHFTVSKYEGGGFSETTQNRKRSKEEHKEITRRYIPAKELAKYRFLMAVTLAPFRSFLAERTKLSGLYNGVKTMLYKRKKS